MPSVGHSIRSHVTVSEASATPPPEAAADRRCSTDPRRSGGSSHRSHRIRSRRIRRSHRSSHCCGRRPRPTACHRGARRGRTPGRHRRPMVARSHHLSRRRPEPVSRPSRRRWAAPRSCHRRPRRCPLACISAIASSASASAVCDAWAAVAGSVAISDWARARYCCASATRVRARRPAADALLAAMSAFAWATLADALAYAACAAAALRWAAASAAWMPARTPSMTVFASVAARVAPTTSSGVARGQCCACARSCAARSTSAARSVPLPALERRACLGDVLLHGRDGCRRAGSRSGRAPAGWRRPRRAAADGLADGGLGLLDLGHRRVALVRGERRGRGGQRRLGGGQLRAGGVRVARDGRDVLGREPGASVARTAFAGSMRATCASTAAAVWGSTWSTFLDQVTERLDARHLVVDHRLGPGAAVDDLLEHRVALVGRLGLVVIELLADDERLAELGLGVLERLLERCRLRVPELGLGEADLLVGRPQRVIGGDEQARRLLAEVLLGGAFLVHGVVGPPAQEPERDAAHEARMHSSHDEPRRDAATALPPPPSRRRMRPAPRGRSRRPDRGARRGGAPVAGRERRPDVCLGGDVLSSSVAPIALFSFDPVYSWYCVVARRDHEQGVLLGAPGRCCRR